MPESCFTSAGCRSRRCRRCRRTDVERPSGQDAASWSCRAVGSEESEISHVHFEVELVHRRNVHGGYCFVRSSVRMISRRHRPFTAPSSHTSLPDLPYEVAGPARCQYVAVLVTVSVKRYETTRRTISFITSFVERPMSAIITTDPIETNGEPSDPPEPHARRRTRTFREHRPGGADASTGRARCRSDTSPARVVEGASGATSGTARDVAPRSSIVAFTVGRRRRDPRGSSHEIPARIVLSGSRCARHVDVRAVRHVTVRHNVC